MQFALPDAFTLGPTLLMPLLLSAILLPLTLVSRYRDENEATWLRAAAISLIAVLAVANILSLALLIDALLGGRVMGGVPTGLPLLRGALIIWAENVVLGGLWYWELDRGGPHRRAAAVQDRHPDFLFPQMSDRTVAPPGWRPRFLDYVYTSFTNATAFSPTDTMPLTARAKLLMMGQSFTSLVIVVLVTARAVNILT